MTISELKRAMDRRFDRLERTKADKVEFRKLHRAMGRRFDRLERGKADKAEIRRLQHEMKRRFDRLERTMVDKAVLERAIASSAAETCRYVDATADSLGSSLGNDIASSAAETRRHFDVVAEATRAEMRLFADPIRNHTDQINQHETRIARLERRSN